MVELNIEHVTSTPYHPESQGVVEGFHQTLKSSLRKVCEGNESLWEDRLPFVLMALRQAPSEITGFSSFELVFGNSVIGPLELFKERMIGDEEGNYVENFESLRKGLREAWKLAREIESGRQEEIKKKIKRKLRKKWILSTLRGGTTSLQTVYLLVLMRVIKPNPIFPVLILYLVFFCIFSALWETGRR